MASLAVLWCLALAGSAAAQGRSFDATEPQQYGARAKKAVDKKLTEQVLIKGGWVTFGTSFADEDVPKDFAPEDKEGAQVESLKETLDADIFSAIAGATGLDKRPSSLSRDGAKTASHRRMPPFLMDPTAVSNDQFKRFVQDAVGLGTQHARANQRMGIHVGRSQGLAGVAQDIGAVARRQRRQGAALDGDLVAEHPGMSQLHAALLTAAKIQSGQNHRVSRVGSEARVTG